MGRSVTNPTIPPTHPTATGPPASEPFVFRHRSFRRCWVAIHDAAVERRPELTIAAAPGTGATTLITLATGIDGWGMAEVNRQSVAWFDRRWIGDPAAAARVVRIVSPTHRADVRLRGMLSEETEHFLHQWTDLHDIDVPPDSPRELWRVHGGRIGSLSRALARRLASSASFASDRRAA